MKNYELFVARRLAFSPEKKKRLSQPIIRIAIAGVALGFTVMIVALAVVSGFKKEIRDKVIGFAGHIQISGFSENNSFETEAFVPDPRVLQKLKTDPGIKHIQTFGTKTGIIKSGTEIAGVVAKGIGPEYDWSFFQSNLKEGRIFHSADSGAAVNDILISKQISRQLQLKAGDELIMYFIQQPPRVRKFKISGIYETGMEEFDKLYILCDLKHIRKLNDWSAEEIGGLELLVKDIHSLEETGSRVYQQSGSLLNARTIKELYPQLFDWLGLQNINAVIIITLMIIVAGINMISALLILILERVRMIGMLKSMGANNRSVRRIFIYIAGFLIGRGLFWGNLFGIGLCLLQEKFGLIKLDQESYYLSLVPVQLSIPDLLLLNAGTLLVCLFMMILPTLLITRISPLKAIRFN